MLPLMNLVCFPAENCKNISLQKQQGKLLKKKQNGRTSSRSEASTGSWEQHHLYVTTYFTVKET